MDKKEFPLNTNYLVDISGNIFNKKGICMKTFHDRNGYRRISLGGKKYYTHRVVAYTFLENPENKPCVDHIDNNILNNCVSNLRWASHSENNLNRKFTKKVDQNIYSYPTRYLVTKVINKKKYNKYFRTYQEAVDYKNSLLKL